MNWLNVRLIFVREVRDQLRDRRTLFTIAVLPLLLYPLLGMAFLQVSQFTHEQPAVVWIVGASQLPEAPPLVERQRFHANLYPEESRLLELQVDDEYPGDVATEAFVARARELIVSGQYSAVVVFPPGFSQALKRFRSRTGPDAVPESSAFPEPRIVFDAASDRSRITSARVGRVLNVWRQSIVRQYLREHQISPHVTHPFEIREVDVSKEVSRRAAFWSKVLPFVVFVWALTGAFYPAVDLCAGEKERGTLETLLSSPAERSEIVMGKLLTIMGFSAATSLLNLLSMAITGTAVIMLQPTLFPIGPPPVLALGWLLLALLPISALFSALALAIAAFARSTKEGQYYLMPLLLISLPLMILPMLPAIRLNLGSSLIPVTGMMLLLRAVVEGQYTQAALFAPPVLAVTGGCCLLAIRWAVDQFNNESVLFRESERLDIGLWLRHLVRDRGMTPTFGQAVACGVILLTIRFFASFAAKVPTTWNEFAIMQFITLAVLVALPVLLMTGLLTRSPRATLLLNPASGKSLVLAVLLALALHPLAMWITAGIQQLYPLNDRMLEQIQGMKQVIASAPSIWHLLVLLALTPAICEELAFRGFILSGLRHLGSKWGAIAISSVLFGVTHGILQQSISATFVGLIIGYIVVQTGSLWPGIAFHLVYNSLALASLAERSWWHWFGEMQRETLSYHWPVIVIGAVLSAAILAWFHRLPHASTPEEELRDALSHQSARATAS
ncbi:MAG: ABC transporter permease subunit/CPBP intramembrane protease [Pirellulaceae bacterium]